MKAPNANTIIIEESALTEPSYWEQRQLLRTLKLRPSLKLTLSYLHDYAGKQGLAYPSQQRLAAEIGLTVRSLQRILQSLEALNLLRVYRTSGLMNRYQFLWSEFQKQSEAVAAEQSATQKNTLQKEHTGDETMATLSKTGRDLKSRSAEPSPMSETPDLNVGSLPTMTSSTPDTNATQNRQTTLNRSFNQHSGIENNFSEMNVTIEQNRQQTIETLKRQIELKQKTVADLSETKIRKSTRQTNGVSKSSAANKSSAASKSSVTTLSPMEFSSWFAAEVRFRTAVKLGQCSTADKLRFFTLWEYVARHLRDEKLQQTLKNPGGFFQSSLKNRQWHGRQEDENAALSYLRSQNLVHNPRTQKHQRSQPTADGMIEVSAGPMATLSRQALESLTGK